MKQSFLYNVKALETANVSTAQIKEHGTSIAVKNSSKVRRFLNLLQRSHKVYLHFRAM